MFKRRRFKQTVSIEDWLAAFAIVARKKPSELPPGQDQAELIRKARQAVITAHIDAWLNSPGLQPPK